MQDNESNTNIYSIRSLEDMLDVFETDVFFDLTMETNTETTATPEMQINETDANQNENGSFSVLRIIEKSEDYLIYETGI